MGRLPLSDSNDPVHSPEAVACPFCEQLIVSNKLGDIGLMFSLHLEVCTEKFNTDNLDKFSNKELV